jgi:VWFA-related protein
MTSRWALRPGRRSSRPDLEVFVGDHKIEPVERLTPTAAGQLHVVLYLDFANARPASVQALSTALVAQSERLASLPGLELVEADPEPKAVPRWRSREELEQVASRLALRGADDDEIARLRSEFCRASSSSSGGAGGAKSGAAGAGAAAKKPASAPAPARARQGLARRPGEEREGETGLRARRRDRDHTARAGRGSVPARDRAPARASGRAAGLDRVAGPHHRSPLAPPARRQSRARPGRLLSQSRPRSGRSDAAVGSGPSLDTLATTIAAYGWTLAPIFPDPAEAERRLKYAPNAQTPVGFKLGIGGKRDRAEPATDLGLSSGGTEKIDLAARRTGGERLGDLATLADRITAFGARPVLRFRAPQVAAGEAQPLSVRSRGGDVLAPDLISSGTPAEIAALRARRAVAGESVEGGLVVRSAIEFDPDAVEESPSRYEAHVDLADLRQRRSGIRARQLPGHARGPRRGRRRADQARRGARRGSQGDEWVREGSLRLPGRGRRRGGPGRAARDRRLGRLLRRVRAPPHRRAVAERHRRPVASGRHGRQPAMVRLVPPDRNVVYGRSRVRAEVDPRVKKLVWMLDNKRVATRRSEPWDVLLDLGSDPRQRLLVAIAYGANDAEVGRDGLILNDAAHGFGVRIVEPRSGRRAGPVDVEAAVDLPQGAALDRVEFYWMDPAGLDRAATAVPPTNVHPGVVRCRVHPRRRATGRRQGAEDVVMLNADRFEEQVTVNLVELYVVVTDRAGKPVRDLDASDFTVLENGVPQRVETFSRAGELPITVGLALDSSLSMFVQMPALQQAAASFVDGLIEQRDQAFLIGFGNQPTVVSAATGDLNHVIEGIRSLEPTGNTAVWEGVVLSMLQLQELAGRKALVVFYDGDDEDEDFSFTTSLKMAEKVGVPVYLIVMNNALARSGPSGFTTKHRAERLERMARTGGGKVYYVSTEADLGAIFTSIRDELRASLSTDLLPRPASRRRTEGAARGGRRRLAPDRGAGQASGPHGAHVAGYEKL